MQKQTQTQNGPTKSPRDVTDKGNQSKAGSKAGSPAVKEQTKPAKKKSKPSETPAATTNKTSSKAPKVVEADYAGGCYAVWLKR